MLQATQNDETLKSVPKAASWLGGLGLAPFVYFALVVEHLDLGMKVSASFALVAYGAVILSFLGGIHWGLAIASATVSWSRLGLSTLPSLIAWAALIIPFAQGVLLLAISFACALAIDWRATNVGEAPAWYPKLRWPLTVVTIIALIAGLRIV